MITVEQFCQYMDSFAPRRLAEDWDNVGLLIGDRQRLVERAMTCLTVTPESVQEAVANEVNLIVTHHPVPFRPLKRITTDSVTGRLLLTLMEHRCAVYSPHTSFDSAQQGINARLAEGLGIADPMPLQPFEGDPDALGAGRYGRLKETQPADAFLNAVKSLLNVDGLHVVTTKRTEVKKVAVACGSAGQFLPTAIRQGCDCFVTGETNFHTCLEAKANDVTLVLPGHFASERFALEVLADRLREEFPDCQIWASNQETDPLSWV